jgi:hypothetical protein
VHTARLGSLLSPLVAAPRMLPISISYSSRVADVSRPRSAVAPPQYEPDHTRSHSLIAIQGIHRRWGTSACKMENKFDFATIASAVFVAGYVAIMLGCVALYDFGLSRKVVSSRAMIAAIPIAALVAVDFFKKRGNVE